MVQRVTRARVRVAGSSIAAIDEGLLALVGVGEGDDQAHAEQLADKLIHMRVFKDGEGKMNLSLIDTRGDLCLVSQFTLWGDLRKGRRPSYAAAARPEKAEPLFQAVVQRVQSQGVTVVTGKFGADMEVELLNDGPVTLLIDTDRLF